MGPPTSRSMSASLTLAILVFILFFFLGVSCLTLLLLGVTTADGSWRSLLALIGASAVLTTAVVAGVVGALAMWFQLRVRSPEPPAGPGPEPSGAFREDAHDPPRRRRPRKPPPTDEAIPL